MREITTHKVNGCNEALKVQAVDEPGSGGANHSYLVRGFDTTSNPSSEVIQGDKSCRIMFQNGPLKEAGINGVTNEVLLAIVVDRLQCFQTGPYKCRENALALTKLEEAMHWLHHRTREREQRGVEGTHTV